MADPWGLGFGVSGGLDDDLPKRKHIHSLASFVPLPSKRKAKQTETQRRLG